MTSSAPVVDDRAALVRLVTDRVAARLVDAIESEESIGDTSLASDTRRQQLMVGAWLGDELAIVNQERLRRGQPSLPEALDYEIRARVVPS